MNAKANKKKEQGKGNEGTVTAGDKQITEKK